MIDIWDLGILTFNFDLTFTIAQVKVKLWTEIVTFTFLFDTSCVVYVNESPSILCRLASLLDALAARWSAADPFRMNIVYNAIHEWIA